MKRFVLLTVGKTHSGKTTFAHALEKQLCHAIVIDQDNHAAFINAHYRALLPKSGANTLKHAVSETILDYAVDQTSFHLILCNANRSLQWRSKLLTRFRNQGFASILVFFDIPEEELQKRIAQSNRSKDIFRSASGFEGVLMQQQTQSTDVDYAAPLENEADYFFKVTEQGDADAVMAQVVCIVGGAE